MTWFLNEWIYGVYTSTVSSVVRSHVDVGLTTEKETTTGVGPICLLC